MINVKIKPFFKVEKEYSVEAECALEEVVLEMIDDFCSEYWLELGSFVLREPKGQDFEWVSEEELKKSCSHCIVEINDESGNIELCPITSFLEDDYYKGCLEMEMQDLYHCHVWVKQLQDFINSSRWQCGLMDQNGKIHQDKYSWPVPVIDGEGGFKWLKDDNEWNPVIWFGIPKQEPLSMWILSVDGKIDALISKDYADKNNLNCYWGAMEINDMILNYELLFNGCTYWYFSECGNEGADIEKILSTLPIPVNILITGEVKLLLENCLPTPNGK